MKIAVNTRFLLPELEGFGWYTHEIVRRMVLANPEDEFIFFFDRPFDARFIYAPNVTPVVLPPKARFAPLFYTWFEWSVRRALLRYRAEVFFSPDSMCSLSSKVPVVMTCHDLAPLHAPQQIPWVHRPYLLHFLPKFLRRADHVLTVSQFVRQDIAQTCGVSTEKITAVYNGCRDIFQPLDEETKAQVRIQFSGGHPYFFYAGAIHPRKNIARLIRAFDLFKTKTGAPHQLLLAGRFAWKTEEVGVAIKTARHRADIRLLGYIPEVDLARLTASATALTYLSLNEGFGLPMLEAMSCDTPVLAANATCLPEIAGDAALLVDPLSEAEIAKGLEKLAHNPSFAQQLIENGRKQRLKFSWDAAAEQIYQILRRVRTNGAEQSATSGGLLL
ncbi:MAG: glycosyltransferase family 1 protein [Saprospiraceae bacterium]|nr:glycosyltransferase family 1 protein [Saprospiraceae bacterium]